MMEKPDAATQWPASTGLPPQRLTFSSENKRRCSWLYVMVFYAGAVSAALIVLAVVGGLHVNKLENTPICKEVNVTQLGTWTNYTAQVKAGTKGAQVSTASVTDNAEFLLNTLANKQMMVATDSSVTILDMNKGLLANYDRTMDECFLVGGLDSDMASAAQIEDYIKNNALDGDADEVVEYTKGDVMKDVDILPSELKSVCVGRHVHWLRKSTTDTGGVRIAADEVGITGCRLVTSCRWIFFIFTCSAKLKCSWG